MYLGKLIYYRNEYEQLDDWAKLDYLANARYNDTKPVIQLETKIYGERLDYSLVVANRLVFARN